VRERERERVSEREREMRDLAEAAKFVRRMGQPRFVHFLEIGIESPDTPVP
jgi:hypothetical protein